MATSTAIDAREQLSEYMLAQVVCYSVLGLTWALVILRAWVRIFLVRSFGWDDATMVFSVFLFTGFCATVLVIVRLGFLPAVFPFEKTFLFIRLIVAAEITYMTTITVLKISLCFFMRRIVVKKWHAVVNYIILAAAVMSGLLSLFFTTFRCGPPAEYPIQQVTGKCWGGNPAVLAFAYQHAIVATVTDFALMILPITILASLKISRRSRLMLGIILLVGCAGCVASLVRFKFINGLANQYNIRVFLRDVNQITLWSTIECTVCICCGCFATLRPVGHILAETRVGAAISNKIKSMKFPCPKLNFGISWKSLPPTQSLRYRRSGYGSSGLKTRSTHVRTPSNDSNKLLKTADSRQTPNAMPSPPPMVERVPSPIHHSMFTRSPARPISPPISPPPLPTAPVPTLISVSPIRAQRLISPPPMSERLPSPPLPALPNTPQSITEHFFRIPSSALTTSRVRSRSSFRLSPLNFFEFSSSTSNDSMDVNASSTGGSNDGANDSIRPAPLSLKSPQTPKSTKGAMSPRSPAPSIPSRMSSLSPGSTSLPLSPDSARSPPSSHRNRIFDAVPVRYMPGRAGPRVVDLYKPLPPVSEGGWGRRRESGLYVRDESGGQGRS